jgi:hypothetical protein
MSLHREPMPPYESWIERQIREAQARGDFDDLPGTGKPLPDLDAPRDDLWWVKKLMRRENLSLTPPLLALRKDREAALGRALEAGSEAEVRGIIAEVNARIRDFNARPAAGPASDLVPLDVEGVVERWRARQG